jgi:hypothetical protein
MIGKHVKFSIEKKHLAKNVDIFDGALKDIIFS